MISQPLPHKLGPPPLLPPVPRIELLRYVGRASKRASRFENREGERASAPRKIVWLPRRRRRNRKLLLSEVRHANKRERPRARRQAGRDGRNDG